MRHEDRPRFIDALTTLAEVFGRPLSIVAAEAFFEDLSGYPIDHVVEAIGQWRATNHTGFMPVPGQLAEIINSLPPSAEQRRRLLDEGEVTPPTESEAREFLAELRRILRIRREGDDAAQGPKPFPSQRDEASGAPESASGADHDREKTP